MEFQYYFELGSSSFNRLESDVTGPLAMGVNGDVQSENTTGLILNRFFDRRSSHPQ